jgi:hypothetical protein
MILLSLGVAGTLSYYWLASGDEPQFALHMTTFFQALLTFVFAIMGIDLSREQRREHIGDMVTVHSGRTAYFLWGQILEIGFMDMVVTLLIASGCLIRLLMDNTPGLWIGQTMLYIALLYFLPCWISGVSGLYIAHRTKGKSAYLIVMALWLVTSSLNTGLLRYVQTMGVENSGYLMNFLNMGIINYHVLTNAVTKMPIELPRWVARAGILTLMAGLFVSDGSRQFASTHRQKKRKQLAFILVVVCVIAFMAFCHQRYAIFFTRFADPEDITMYALAKSKSYVPGESVSLADYPAEKNITLIHTDIELNCTTQGIQAKVEMDTIADSQINDQSFTLFSDLVVDRVLVDGEEAVFERSHDGLLVNLPGGREAYDPVTFTFCYHGYSLPIFPANETTVQLNRAFPWIPWPGIKQTTSYGNYYNYNESEDFFIEDWQREDEVHYTLHYRGPGSLYTNLTAQGDHVYEGTSSNGISLYSGMLNEKYRDVAVSVPASLHQSTQVMVDALLDAYDPLLAICKKFGAKKMPEKPESVILIQMRYPAFSAFAVSNELYSWGDEWEIRQPGLTSSILSARKMYADSPDEYRASAEVARMAVSYLLNPCTGYPVDVSHASTNNYAAWLAMYLTTGRLNENEQAMYRDLLKEDHTGTGRERINGVLVPETPLTSEEEGWIDDILDRMKAGESFDEPFAALYQELLQQKNITASDIVSRLYHHQGA